VAICPSGPDLGPNLAAVFLAAIAALVSIYSAYRTTKIAAAANHGPTPATDTQPK
jgi:hypothetical protein